MTEQLIKSKERVQQRGEVFTPQHIVSDMVDLADFQSKRLKTTFMDSTCRSSFTIPEIQPIDVEF